ncbi:DUF433 domain-containing protein [Methylobacterium sp. Leaf87]|uniref:DUF433 domain-containing protein n=1 Tax=Methylobacterium sp. Leaf87 TaxID=1736243 RepID=UPI0009EBDAA9|nr:DUF433 domain-containing protein [Methylobacterium sp. Leaf87]
MKPTDSFDFIADDIPSREKSRIAYEPSDPGLTLQDRVWVGDRALYPRRSFLRSAEWFIESRAQGLDILKDTVDIDRSVRGGVPVLKGTRFTIAQLLAELSETRGPDEIAENFDLSADQIRNLLNGLAMLMNKPHGR